MPAGFNAYGGQFWSYYVLAASGIQIDGQDIALPSNLYRAPSGGLTTAVNGRPVANLALAGVGDVTVTPSVLYFSSDGRLTNRPNGPPIAELTESGGVLNITNIETGD